MTDIEKQIWTGMVSGRLSGESLPTIDMETGTRIQLAMLARYISEGEQLAGYKVGLTSGAARDAFGVGIRPFGYILQSRVFESGETVAFANHFELGLENELVFKLGADLSAPDITAEQARAAVTEVAPGFEINQNRVHGPVSPGIRIAENLSQWGLVVGDFVTPEKLTLDLEVTATHDGKLVERVSGQGHIDDHYESIATLARQLYVREKTLLKGMLVITGSYTRFQVSESGTYEGDFGPLGRVSLIVS